MSWKERGTQNRSKNISKVHKLRIFTTSPGQKQIILIQLQMEKLVGEACVILTWIPRKLYTGAKIVYMRYTQGVACTLPNK